MQNIAVAVSRALFTLGGVFRSEDLSFYIPCGLRGYAKAANEGQLKTDSIPPKADQAKREPIDRAGRYPARDYK
jgi:hypothetical protein